MSKYSIVKTNLFSMYLKSLEENIIPWEKMWTTKIPKNVVTNIEYNGINNLMLSYIANKRGYKSNRWCTFKQMKDNRWKFRECAKGKGIKIEYFSKFNVKENKKYSFKEYQEIIEKYPEMEEDFTTIRKYTEVYNEDIIEGIPKEKTQEQPIPMNDYIDNIIKNLGVKYEEEGSSAYYDIEEDKVIIPPSEKFKSVYAYYATQLHELAHATGHSSRMNRKFGTEKGSLDYAREELRAEISSSFFMQKLGLQYDKKHLDNHKAYVQNWIKLLKSNSEELFKAISDADKIFDYLEDKSINKSKNYTKENDIEEEMDYEY